MSAKTRRGKGEGGVYQRCDHPSCPATIDVFDEETGKTKKARPPHACRGRWVANLDLGRRSPKTGKRERKVIYGKTKAEVVRKLGEAKAQHQKSALVVAAPTVEQWLRYWLDEIAVDRVRPRTLENYRGYIETHLVPGIGRHRLDRLEPSHVRQLWSTMRKPCTDPVRRDADDPGRCEHKPRHGRAEATVRQAHAILSRALTVAVREGKAGRNVCEMIDPPGTAKATPTPLSVAEAKLVLRAAKGDPLEARWLCALYLGMRQGEVLGLTWGSVQLDDGVLWVERAVQRQKGRGLVVAELKSRSSHRVLPLPTVVRSHLTVEQAKHLERCSKATHDSCFVWARDGKPLDPARDSRAWGALLKKAGVRHVRLHAARNTTGSLLLAAGIDPKIVSEILGHSTVQITQNVYQRGELPMHRAALEAVADLVDES